MGKKSYKKSKESGLFASQKGKNKNLQKEGRKGILRILRARIIRIPLENQKQRLVSDCSININCSAKAENSLNTQINLTRELKEARELCILYKGKLIEADKIILDKTNEITVLKEQLGTEKEDNEFLKAAMSKMQAMIDKQSVELEKGKLTAIAVAKPRRKYTKRQNLKFGKTVICSVETLKIESLNATKCITGKEGAVRKSEQNVEEEQTSLLMTSLNEGVDEDEDVSGVFTPLSKLYTKALPLLTTMALHNDDDSFSDLCKLQN